jgi:excisionase family DNA binding protein
LQVYAKKHMSVYLNTEQAADYLGIKERKLYELVANGAVPCSKVTGKWLFPRAALDRWIEAGLARPLGFDAVSPPPIVGGSHDPLLEWAVRRSGSGLALLSVGSEAGLAKLAANEIAVAAIHIHAPPGAEDEDGNLTVVAADHLLHDAVVIAFARREQGLVLPPGNPKGIRSLKAAVAAKARFARRQPGAGAELLLKRLMHAEGLAAAALEVAPSRPGRPIAGWRAAPWRRPRAWPFCRWPGSGLTSPCADAAISSPACRRCSR